MPRETAKGRRPPQAPVPREPSHTRIEMRFGDAARELKDLEAVADQISGNAQRKGEASSYIVRMWSRVIHGELSPSAFWEIFGVASPPPPQYPMMIMPGYPQGAPGMVPPTLPVAEPVVEDP